MGEEISKSYGRAESEVPLSLYHFLSTVSQKRGVLADKPSSVFWIEDCFIFNKLHMGLVVLVKKCQSSFIFYCKIPILCQSWAKFEKKIAGHVWQEWRISWTLLTNQKLIWAFLAKKRKENACGSVAFCTIKVKWGVFIKDLQNIIPDKFGSTGQVVSKEKIEIWKVY